MEKEITIRTLQTSIFLKEGAFVRWKGIWYAFQGPFESLNSANSQVVSISCQDFFGHQISTFQASETIKLNAPSWKELFKSEGGSRSFHWKGPSRELYSQSFQQTQSEIAQGNWKKAVPMALDFADGTLKDEDKIALLSRLSDAHESLIPYGFWKDGRGMIGLTPEILFFRDQDQLTTMALAGTEKKQGACHLLQDQKNLKEHDFVVKELHEKLAAFGEVSAQGPQILELPTLYHLQTHFQVKLHKPVAYNQQDAAKSQFANHKPQDWKDLKLQAWQDLAALQFLHPTSALGVSPFTRWRELEKLPQQKERGFFGSPLLFNLGHEQSLALVALRQVQWDEKGLKLGAGGGVVQESQEELEWNEILAKMDSVKKLMGIS